LEPFQKLAFMLLDHLDGILNYCRTKVPFGVMEAINGNIKTLLRRGRGYKNLGDLLLKAQRIAVTKTEFIVLQIAAQNAGLYEFLCRAEFAKGSRPPQIADGFLQVVVSKAREHTVLGQMHCLSRFRYYN
jgi:hypothetical protein